MSWIVRIGIIYIYIYTHTYIFIKKKRGRGEKLFVHALIKEKRGFEGKGKLGQFNVPLFERESSRFFEVSKTSGVDICV